MKAIPEGLLEEVTRRLVEEFDPEAIYLFGSHAWGTPTEDSDLDILIIVADSDIKPTQRAVRAHQALSGLGCSKDILVRTRSEVAWAKRVHASLISQILDEGKIVWMKQSVSL